MDGIYRTIFLVALHATLLGGAAAIKTAATDWQLGPFIKQDHVNPILDKLNDTTFLCPMRNDFVYWEAKDVFNPTALVRDGKIHLLYRAEDEVGEFHGTSRIGLAISDDGLTFDREEEPIFYPDHDSETQYEWEGGCEDPRIVEDESGTYYMTYTAYDGTVARLLIATTSDLRVWQKHGPIFKNTNNESFINLWSKSGSIVTNLVGDKSVATKIQGQYWMYWGDTDIFYATSSDLVNWTPGINETNGELITVFGPRAGMFDSDLVEPGPQAIMTDDGILLVYNGRNKKKEDGGDPALKEGTYSAGQILLDKTRPWLPLEGQRSQEYFMTPDKDYEIIGQIGNVVFLEGLVFYKGKWFLYYGTADSRIAVASYTPQPTEDSAAAFLASNYVSILLVSIFAMFVKHL